MNGIKNVPKMCKCQKTLWIFVYFNDFIRLFVLCLLLFVGRSGSNIIRQQQQWLCCIPLGSNQTTAWIYSTTCETTKRVEVRELDGVSGEIEW